MPPEQINPALQFALVLQELLQDARGVGVGVGVDVDPGGGVGVTVGVGVGVDPGGGVGVTVGVGVGVALGVGVPVATVSSTVKLTAQAAGVPGAGVGASTIFTWAAKLS